MSDFWKHRKVLKNGHNPGGRTLRFPQVLKASEGTLNQYEELPHSQNANKTKGVE
jgi:hypothetical protein